MAKRKGAFQRKTRTREHFIADLAINHVERQILLAGCTFERVVHDYGLDGVVFAYNASGEAEPGVLYLQVKASDHVRCVENGQAVSTRVSRGDLQNWLAQPIPVILILYEAIEGVAYWVYIQHHFERLSGFILSRSGESVTVRIPTMQVLTPSAIRGCTDTLNKKTQ